MEYFNPVIFMAPTDVEQAREEVRANKKADDESIGLNLGYFFSDEAKAGDGVPDVVNDIKEIRKKSSSSPRTKIDRSELPANNQIQTDEKVPYIETYVGPANVLNTAITQSDQLLSEIKGDIDDIRKSKTLKGKYTYITNLTSSAATLINTRITAARSIMDSITQSHNLELKRTKDLKEMQRDDKNDDARMMEMYNAFINNPVGMYDNAMNMPTIPKMMLGPNEIGSGVGAVSMAAGSGDGQPLTPEQIRMRMEGNPNIEEVVMYDAASGRRWFEVHDKSTGQPVPNYPVSDNFLLDDTVIDVRAGIAKNRNLDRVWPLITLGQLTEY